VPTLFRATSRRGGTSRTAFVVLIGCAAAPFDLLQACGSTALGLPFGAMGGRLTISPLRENAAPRAGSPADPPSASAGARIRHGLVLAIGNSAAGQAADLSGPASCFSAPANVASCNPSRFARARTD